MMQLRGPRQQSGNSGFLDTGGHVGTGWSTNQIYLSINAHRKQDVHDPPATVVLSAPDGSQKLSIHYDLTNLPSRKSVSRLPLGVRHLAAGG